MQLRHVLSELGSGLRRNLSMHLAVVLTLFVSLTLAGVGALMSHQAAKTADTLGSQLEVIVWMCTPDDPVNNACTGEVTDVQKRAIETAIDGNAEVSSYDYESKEEALEKTKELYPELDYDGEDAVITLDAMPQSYWITLKDPEQAEGIKSAVDGLAGVSYVKDGREGLEPVYNILDALKYGSWGAAAFLVLAALLLVANTIRLAALARRREIGIMRLVGASTLYITLPFLLEAVVIAIVGVVLAAGALAAFMKYAVRDQLAEQINFLPWIGWDDYWSAVVGLWPPGILWLGIALTVVPTLLLTRKYVKV